MSKAEEARTESCGMRASDERFQPMQSDEPFQICESTELAHTGITPKKGHKEAAVNLFKPIIINLLLKIRCIK